VIISIITINASNTNTITITKYTGTGGPVTIPTNINSLTARSDFFDLCVNPAIQAGLTHLIMLRSGDAFINQSFIVAAPLVVLIGAGGLWHFVSG
jgi:hypothetical protein